MVNVDSLLTGVTVICSLLAGLVYWHYRRLRCRSEELSEAKSFLTVFQKIPQPLWVCDSEQHTVFAINEAALQLYGCSHQHFVRAALEGWGGSNRVPVPAPKTGHGVKLHVDTEVREVAYGSRRFLLVSATDVEARLRAAAAEQERHSIVEMIARGEPLEKTLGQLAHLVENQSSKLRCSVLILRNGRLYTAAAGNTPERFLQELNGLPIHGESGAVSTAPYWGHSLLVSNIKTDSRWEPHRRVALAGGLQACWSAPILSGVGEILGTLAAYLENPSRPDDAEIELLKGAARLAGIAIEQRHLTDELFYQAHYDPLTQLANRAIFEERVTQAITAARHARTTMGLLYIDLDRFKLVNDVLGHSIGDLLLSQVARRLESCVRRSDILARLGGDEFGLLLAEIHDTSGATNVARKILDSLRDPFQIEGHELFVTGSIGISLFPKDGDNVGTLERNADSAMYRAKRLGADSYVLFDTGISTSSPERLEMETHLRRALERKEMILHYQPQYDARTGEMAGMEALIRWKHPSLGMVSPGTFIPIAEETGLIIPIGAWTLNEACRQQRVWRDSGMRPVRVAVNVSPLQFGQPDLVESVAQALDRNDIPARLLELELTESGIMQDIDRAIRQMYELRNLGVQLAIDDFGTGHSSLSYLQRLPLETLKVDQCFVREVRAAGDRPPLVESIISMGHALGMRLVAEGVETPDQFDALVAMQCDLLQGYLLSKPVSPEEVLRGASSPFRIEALNR